MDAHPDRSGFVIDALSTPTTACSVSQFFGDTLIFCVSSGLLWPVGAVADPPGDECGSDHEVDLA
jgi:hypothetical protein